MLTEKQLQELEPLTRHPKYGELLKNAIETWKYSEPIEGEWGIFDEEGVYQFLSGNPKCCLLGASLVGKHKDYDFDSTSRKIYNLTNEETIHLRYGFDNMIKVDTEAWKFGNEVRKIVIDHGKNV